MEGRSIERTAAARQGGGGPVLVLDERKLPRRGLQAPNKKNKIKYIGQCS
jgi:hypothetical protein